MVGAIAPQQRFHGRLRSRFKRTDMGRRSIRKRVLIGARGMANEGLDNCAIGVKHGESLRDAYCGHRALVLSSFIDNVTLTVT